MLFVSTLSNPIYESKDDTEPLTVKAIEKSALLEQIDLENVPKNLYSQTPKRNQKNDNNSEPLLLQYKTNICLVYQNTYDHAHHNILRQARKACYH